MNEKKIALLDDEGTWLEIFRRVLVRGGVPTTNIVDFVRADDALKHLKKNPDIAVLISDYKLETSAMNGDEVIEHVKELYPSIHCILASSGGENREKASGLGVDFLLKRDYNHNLVRMVKQKLNLNQS
jgi:CheY-like chemotaxis protein